MGYYFRLGAQILYRDRNEWRVFLFSERRSHFELKADQFIRISSAEQFVLGNSTMGIFGQSSELTERGLQLIHSPYIDPYFSGHLKMGIKNLTESTIIIEWAQIIGKVSFFDISDTYPVEKPESNSIIGKKFRTLGTYEENTPPLFHYSQDDGVVYE